MIAVLPLRLPLRLACSLAFASSWSNASSSSSFCLLRLVELALDTSHACPFDSRVEEDIAVPVRKSQSESFLSLGLSALKLNSSLVIPLRNFGVVVPDRGCVLGGRWILDLLFARPVFTGLRIEIREDDRERIEGVVGADLPSR